MRSGASIRLLGLNPRSCFIPMVVTVLCCALRQQHPLACLFFSSSRVVVVCWLAVAGWLAALRPLSCGSSLGCLIFFSVSLSLPLLLLLSHYALLLIVCSLDCFLIYSYPGLPCVSIIIIIIIIIILAVATITTISITIISTSQTFPYHHCHCSLQEREREREKQLIQSNATILKNY